MSINEFLSTISSEIKAQEKEYSSDDYYYKLKYLGIKKDTSLYEDIEEYFKDFRESLEDALVKYEVRSTGTGSAKTNYISFYASKKADYKSAYKVYFPVKYEYMISALKTVFLYLIRNNIKSTVKFYERNTNEGIVIRFYNKDDVQPFIDYCNNSFALKDLLVKPNPFIATIYGIGVIQDDNVIYSFNEMLAVLLKEYYHVLLSNGTIDNANELSFLDFAQKRCDIEENETIKFDITCVINSMKAIINRTSPLD